MPFWDWHHPLTFRRGDQHLHNELLLALGRLNVVSAALHNEINNTTEGASNNDHPGASQY